MKMNPLHEREEHVSRNIESGKIKKLGATIFCENLSFYVGSGKSKKQILSNLDISFQPGELVALMGPSGAGKTTLLNVLSGRASGTLSGKIVVDNKPLNVNVMKKTTCVVPQHDILIGCLTARTALQYAADMRLNCSAAEKKKKIDDVLKELSLTECADVIIGSEDVKGLSGGQRKRVCIALELITDPRVLFLDEPTSGLDSRIAEDVIMLLQQLARAGRTIICTIHQPSEKVFKIFDKLVVLRRGKLCYHASISKIGEFFNYIKEPKIAGATAPEHFFNILAVKENPVGFDSFQGAFKEWDSQFNECAVYEHHDEAQTVVMGNEKMHFEVKWYIQFWALFRRHVYKSLKEPIVTLVRVLQVVFISLFFGSIYWQLPLGQNNYNDKLSVMFLLIMLNGITTMLGQIIVMPLDKNIFLKEYRNGYYPAYVYFWSVIIVNMMFQFFYDLLLAALTYYSIGFHTTITAFITYAGVFMLVGGIGISLGFGFGCLLQDVIAAVALMPILLCPLVLFTGLLIKPANIPIWWRWMYYVSFFQYGFQLLVVNEFRNISFIPCDKAVPLPNVKCPFGFCNQTPADPYGILSPSQPCAGTFVITLMGYNVDNQIYNWIALSGIFVALVLFAWFSFKKLSRKPI